MPTIQVIEFIELDLQRDPLHLVLPSPLQSSQFHTTDNLENPQTANRYLCNPVHNLVVNTLQEVAVSAKSILKLASLSSDDGTQPNCIFRSATIPQYFTNAWLLGVSAQIGIVTNLQTSNLDTVLFEDYTDDPKFSRVNYYANWGIVSFPQRPEYLQYGFPSSEIPVRRLSDPSDYLFERSAKMVNSNEEIDMTFLASVTQTFRIGSEFNSIQFPPEYGFQLQYSDIALSSYRWIRVDDTITNCYLKVTYQVDFDLELLSRTLIDILKSRGLRDDEAKTFVQSQFQKFDLPVDNLNHKTYHNLHTTWVRNSDVTIPVGLSKSYGAATFVPTRCRLIYGVPYTRDHTDKLKLRMEVNSRRHVLHTVVPRQKKQDGYHIAQCQAGLMGPVKAGICSHQHLHLPIKGLQNQIWIPDSKGPIINHPSKVILRLIGKHHNPHDRFIDSSSILILYWEALAEIPFDPETQVFPDDPCLSGYLNRCEQN